MQKLPQVSPISVWVSCSLHQKVLQNRLVKTFWHILKKKKKKEVRHIPLKELKRYSLNERKWLVIHLSKSFKLHIKFTLFQLSPHCCTLYRQIFMKLLDSFRLPSELPNLLYPLCKKTTHWHLWARCYVIKCLVAQLNLLELTVSSHW